MVRKVRPPDQRRAYDVGYKKPPKRSRFRPGQSGNPKGRPKGVRNFATDVKETLKSKVQVTRGGKPTRVSTQQAALLRLREKALSGDPRALDLMLALARSFNNDEVVPPTSLSADDAAVLEVYMKRVNSGAAHNPQAVNQTKQDKDETATKQ